MKSFDQLFATAGQPVPVGVMPRQGRRRTRSSYELMVEERALESLRPQSVDWRTKVHHAQDLDPIRDEEPEEVDAHEIERSLRRQVNYERVLTPVQAVKLRSVYIRIEEEDVTLYDGIPAEAILREDKRPFKGSPARPLVAEALRRRRAGLPSKVLAYQE